MLKHTISTVGNRKEKRRKINLMSSLLSGCAYKKLPSSGAETKKLRWENEKILKFNCNKYSDRKGEKREEKARRTPFDSFEHQPIQFKVIWDIDRWNGRVLFILAKSVESIVKSVGKLLIHFESLLHMRYPSERNPEEATHPSSSCMLTQTPEKVWENIYNFI